MQPAAWGTALHPARLLQLGPFAKLPSVGPYLVKSLLAVLTLTDRIRFDAGVMPPGSYSSVRYLLTGDPKLVKRGLWPWSTVPRGAHHRIDQLARLEGCDWQDVQAALCRWAPWRRDDARATDLSDEEDNTGED